MEVNIELGSILEGKVVKIKPFGVIVSLANNKHGLVHISHISSDFVQDINDYLAVGDSIKVKVISVDQDKSKISLSIKDVNKDPDSEVKQPKVEEKRHQPDNYYKNNQNQQSFNFEDKLKDFMKSSNERIATINKRNKKR